MCTLEILDTLPWVTELIALRRVEPTDANFICSIESNPAVRKYLGVFDHQPEEIAASIETGQLNYIMIDSQELNATVGYSGFFKNEEAGGMDILVSIDPKYQRKGFAKAALIETASRWEAFHPDIPITISTSPENSPTISLLEQSGFSLARQYDKIPGFGFKMNVYTRNSEK